MVQQNNPVKLVETKRFEDDRGWFVEAYNVERFAALGIAEHFVQDNHSLSRPAGTIRGLHFQLPPSGQAKLVRCIAGSIFDVAVDLRVGSPTFGRWVGAELSADNQRQLFVPVGFAHGFVTLEPETQVTYKVTALYDPKLDAGIRWNDEEIGIDWRLPACREPRLSPKDAALPLLSSFKSPFPYDGAPLLPLEI